MVCVRAQVSTHTKSAKAFHKSFHQAPPDELMGVAQIASPFWRRSRSHIAQLYHGWSRLGQCFRRSLEDQDHLGDLGDMALHPRRLQLLPLFSLEGVERRGAHEHIKGRPTTPRQYPVLCGTFVIHWSSISCTEVKSDRPVQPQIELSVDLGSISNP